MTFGTDGGCCGSSEVRIISDSINRDTPPQFTSEPVIARDLSRHFHWHRGIRFGLEFERRTRRRPVEAALEPAGKMRLCAEIHIDRAADHRGDIEVGDGKASPSR